MWGRVASWSWRFPRNHWQQDFSKTAYSLYGGYIFCRTACNFLPVCWQPILLLLALYPHLPQTRSPTPPYFLIAKNRAACHNILVRSSRNSQQQHPWTSSWYRFLQKSPCTRVPACDRGAHNQTYRLWNRWHQQMPRAGFQHSAPVPADGQGQLHTYAITKIISLLSVVVTFLARLYCIPQHYRWTCIMNQRVLH